MNSDVTDTLYHKVKDKLEVLVSEVDDVAKFWCFTDANSIGKPVYTTEYTKSATHGKGNYVVSNDLVIGEKNYLLFALFNRVYDAGGVFKGGKWSYAMELLLNNERVWKKFDLKTDYDEIKEKRGNDKFTFSSYFGKRSKAERDIITGLKYYKVFELDVDNDGRVSPSEVIDENVFHLVKAFMDKEDEGFKKDPGEIKQKPEDIGKED